MIFYFQTQEENMERFKIISKIGQGNFSKVYVAQHIATGINVAIKIINKEQIRNNKDILMIQKEINILKDVSHQGIAEMYQLFEDEQHIYIVFEYVERGTLLDLIKQYEDAQLFDDVTLVRIFGDIVEAVYYLHERRIAHRDLKLANILIDRQFRSKLTDFGLSAYYSSNNNLRTSCGSPCFAAPQILMGNHYNPQKTDVWSLGVIFYCMLAGQLPFYDEQAEKLYKKIWMGKYKPILNKDQELTSILSQMLDTNPQTRTNLEQLKRKMKNLRSKYLIKTLKLEEKIEKDNKIHEKIKKLTLELVRQHYPELSEQNFERYLARDLHHVIFNDMNTVIQLYYQKVKKQMVQRMKVYLKKKQENYNSQITQSLKISSDGLIKSYRNSKILKNNNQSENCRLVRKNTSVDKYSMIRKGSSTQNKLLSHKKNENQAGQSQNTSKTTIQKYIKIRNKSPKSKTSNPLKLFKEQAIDIGNISMEKNPRNLEMIRNLRYVPSLFTRQKEST